MGGSVALGSGGSLLLVDTTISGSTGNAIYAENANVTIHGSTFEDIFPAPVAGSGAVVVANCWSEIYNTAFVRNNGAINIVLGNANIVDCTFDSNIAAGYPGAAVHIDKGYRYRQNPPQATVSFTGCTFTGNQNKTGSNDISNIDNFGLNTGANVTFHCPAGTT